MIIVLKPSSQIVFLERLKKIRQSTFFLVLALLIKKAVTFFDCLPAFLLNKMYYLRSI